MLVTTLDEGAIADIGHAFGYYDYGEESGLSSLFPSQEATAAYIRGYARGMLRGGFLHTNSPRQEGFLAFKRPGERLGLPTLGLLAKGLLQSMTLRELVHFAQLMKRAGPGLDDQLKREKTPFLFVGMVCVREEFQGQGYMRQVMDLAFREGDRLGVPVVLNTDAWSKCVKYQRLGMELAGTRDVGDHWKLYDLIRYPAPSGGDKASTHKREEDSQ